MSRKYRPPLEEWQIIAIGLAIGLFLCVGLPVILYNVFG